MGQAEGPSGNRGRSIAVVGSGVAGLTAAYVLSRGDTVTIYEADGRLGGHADTHLVADTAGREHAVDTGFIVHNDRTYPTLLRLFAELGVPTQDSDMSMSVRCDGCGLEYAGAKKAEGIFAQRPSLKRWRYPAMLAEILRFHRKARALLSAAGPDDDGMTLGDFLAREKFSAYFTAHFMTPVVSAVWSCNPATALAYPALYLFTFLEHHGLLSISGSPQWRTVTGGSGEYVRRIAERLDAVRTGEPVLSVERTGSGVRLRTALGSEDFDAVVIATHPQQALAMLKAPQPAEQEILSAMPYSVNHTLLHRDESVLPRSSKARASWNYRLPDCAARPEHVLVSYDLSRLQRLPASAPNRFIVSLGEADAVDPAQVLDSMTYDHPQYTPASLAAQRRLGELGDSRVQFAGAYHGWGFHEDGALSGLRAAERLGARWDGSSGGETSGDPFGDAVLQGQP